MNCNYFQYDDINISLEDMPLLSIYPKDMDLVEGNEIGYRISSFIGKEGNCSTLLVSGKDYVNKFKGFLATKNPDAYLSQPSHVYQGSNVFYDMNGVAIGLLLNFSEAK